MESGPTPHLEGVYGDYAPTVLLPGDPKRARFIAENYLTNIKLVNSVRGAEGFTGEFNGIPVSVQSVGMGIPSALIYYTELIRFFGVKKSFLGSKSTFSVYCFSLFFRKLPGLFFSTF